MIYISVFLYFGYNKLFRMEVSSPYVYQVQVKKQIIYFFLSTDHFIYEFALLSI